MKVEISLDDLVKHLNVVTEEDIKIIKTHHRADFNILKQKINDVIQQMTNLDEGLMELNNKINRFSDKVDNISKFVVDNVKCST